MASDNYTMNYMMQRARSIINSSKTTNNIDANSVESDDIIICNKIDCNSIKANTIIVYGNVDCNNINAENVLVLNGENDYASLDKKYFDIEDFAKNTLTSAFVSGTVGGVVGAGMYGMSGNVGKEVSKTVKETIINDSITSSSRKVGGYAERNMMAVAYLK